MSAGKSDSNGRFSNSEKSYKSTFPYTDVVGSLMYVMICNIHNLDHYISVIRGVTELSRLAMMTTLWMTVELALTTS